MPGPIIINVRWADNTATLKKNLAEGGTTIEAMRSQVEKLVAGLSGDRIVTQVNRWIAAVDQLGGVTKLTLAETERFNTVLDNAIDKYKALGKAVPDVVTQYKALTKEVVDNADGHSKLLQMLRLNIPMFAGLRLNIAENVEAFGFLGGAMGAVFAGTLIGIEAIKSMVEGFANLAESAKQLRNLSVETGIEVKTLQALGAVAADFGVTTEEMARGIYQLSRRIAGGDESAQGAYELLGIEMSKLRGQKPDEVFLTTLEALQQLDPQLKATAAAELFGARMAQKFLSFKGNLRDLVEEIKKSNEVMGEDAIKDQAKFADSLDHLERSLKALAGTTLAPLMSALADLADWVKSDPAMQVVDYFSSLTAKILALHMPKGFGLVGGAGAGEEFVGPKRGAYLGDFGPEMPEATKNAIAMAKVIKTIREEMKPLTEQQAVYLSQLQSMGQLTAARAKEMGISSVQLEMWKEGISLNRELMKGRAEAAKLNAASDAMEAGSMQNAISTRIEALDAEHNAEIESIKKSGATSRKIHADLENENRIYQAKRRNLEVEGNTEVEKVIADQAKEVAKLQERSTAATLEEKEKAIDQEVYEEQQATLQRIGYTEEEWKAEQAIYEKGEAKKQKLRDDSNKKFADAQRKLAAEIAGIQDESDKVGLERTLATIHAKEQAEEASILREFTDEDKRQKLLAQVREKYAAEEIKAKADFKKQEQKEILAIDQQTQDLEISLVMSGMTQELEVAKIKRDRKLAQLRVEGKDTADMIDAENRLYAAQVETIIAKYDPIRKAWLHLNDDIRQTWADTWTSALEGKNGIQGFVEALLSPFNQIEKAWLKLIGAMVADWEGQFLAKLGFQMPGVNMSTSPSAGAGGALGNALGMFRRTSAPSSSAGPYTGNRGGGLGSFGFMGGEQLGPGQVYDEEENVAQVGGAPGADEGDMGGGGGGGGGFLGLGGGLVSGLASFGISTVISAFMPKIIAGIKRLFGGPSEEEVAGRKESSGFLANLRAGLTDEQKRRAGNEEWKQELVGIQDAYKRVGKNEQDAEVDLKRLWAAEKEGPDAVKKVEAEIQKSMDLAKQAAEELPKIVADVTNGLNEISAGTIGTFNSSLQSMLDSGDKLVTLQENANKLQAEIDDMNRRGPQNEKQKVQLDTWKRQLADVQTQITEQQRINAQGVRNAQDAATGGQAAFDKVGRLAQTAFNAALASGKSFAEAIAEISPTLDDLALAQRKFGFTSSDTLNKLMGFRTFAKDNQALIGTLDGVNKMMSGLQKMGLLTQQDFDDLNSTATDTFNKMVAGGVDSDTALRAMQPTLQQIWEIQQQTGMTVDANTQALIDQATTAGIVGEKQRSVQQQTLDVLTAIAKALGADIPNAAQTGADKANKALSGIHAPDIKFPVIDIPYEYRQQGPNPGGPGGGPVIETAAPSTAARGGFVTPYGVVPQYFKIGGPVAWTPRGSDTVPAMLTPGEFVESAAYRGDLAKGLQQIGDGLHSLASAIMAMAGRDVVVQIDGQEVVRQTNKVLDANTGGLRTQAKDILGIATA